MSDLTSFDLEKLFLPDWATKPASANRFADHAGEEPRIAHDRGRGREHFRREPQSPRRDGPRPQGRGSDRDRRFDRGGRPGRPFQRGTRRDDRREAPREERPPLPDIAVAILPDEKIVDALVRQIRLAGRAFPLFEIAKMVVLKPERYVVRFSIKKNQEGQPLAPLLQCALDETIWFSEDEAVAHVLNRHFNTFYQVERTPTDPPKGVYTFVAQCGMSGTILGPPNHHDYQNQLRKLHAERFSRMPFEVFKSRVKIVRDESVVKKWIEDQSFKTDYVVLNVPEPVRFGAREEVERHFREVHQVNMIKPVETATLDAAALRRQPCPFVGRFVRWMLDEQRRFPMAIATTLSQQFAQRGLQFFKVNRTITHVSVARPHYLDLETTVVADGVRRIVEFINANPKCTRKQLVAALVTVPYKPTEVAPAPPSAPEPESPPAPTGDSASIADEPSSTPVDTNLPKPPAPEPTPELQALNADLHWLIHQGHVIEFHTGILETAKKPQPKAPKPAPAAQPRLAVEPNSPGTEPPGLSTAEASVETSVSPDLAAQVSANENTQPADDQGSDAVPDAPVAHEEIASPVQAKLSSDEATETKPRPTEPAIPGGIPAASPPTSDES